MPTHMPSDLVVRGTANVLGALRLFAGNSGGGVVSNRGLVLMVLSGSKTTGAFHSGAVRRITPANPEDVLRAVRAFATAHRREMVLWASSRADMDIARSAQALGLEPFSTATGMALLMPPADSPAPSHAAVERVVDLDGVAAFAEVHRPIAVESGRPPDSVHLFSSPDVLLNDAVRAFVVRDSARPVACAMVFCTGRDAGMYWVACAREARNRGYGTLAARAASAAAFEMGAAMVVLQSTSLGVPVYRKLGFAPFDSYRRYRITPAAATRVESPHRLP